MKITVVVPVYNPGGSIRRCVRSLLHQTLPREEFEVVFVDDGSTDDAPAYLDRLVGKHPHLRVIHQENSGWPGKPRNVGVAAARGDYIQFLDQDDMLGTDALRRMHEMAVRNRSDIVLGKVVSNFRNVPHQVFAADVEHCTIRDFPLVDSLTPHKMFRRDFLAEASIAFPEGRRRLEDQLFMARAYLAAGVVSILGSYPCYYYLRRGDRGNAGSTRLEPVSYYENLAEVLDVVVAGTEPGELRRSLLRRWLRSEVLRRLSEPVMMKWPKEFREELFRVTREFSLRYFDDEVVAGLPAVTRVRATLLMEGRHDDLLTFARRCAKVRAVPEARQADVDGALHLTMTAQMCFTDGEPVRLVDRGGRLVLDPRLVGGLVDDSVADVSSDDAGVRIHVSTRERRSRVQWQLPSDLTASMAPAGAPDGLALVATGTATIDPRVAAGGEPLADGLWEVSASVNAYGLSRKARLRLSAPLPGRARLGTPPHQAVPVTSGRGSLSLKVGANPPAPPSSKLPPPRWWRRRGARLWRHLRIRLGR